MALAKMPKSSILSGERNLTISYQNTHKLLHINKQLIQLVTNLEGE